MERLGVFYTCNDAYAPFAGVSMVSLLEHNRDMPGLAIYLIGQDISPENRQKLEQAAAAYGCPFTLIDAAPVLEKIQEIGVPAWRNAGITNVRLFYEQAFAGRPLPPRLLYLDCDTLVTGSLEPLATWEMDDCPLAMVCDSLTGYYKAELGFLMADKYYNGGVMLFDTAAWAAQGCTDYLTRCLREKRSDFALGDQDITNLYMKGRIATLPPEYNAQAVHRAYPLPAFFAVYPEDGYYTAAQLALADARPVILHTFRFLGDFPWHKDNLHPDTAAFDRYLALSPWKDYEKKPGSTGTLFRLEKLLYCILPKAAFLRLFRTVQTRSFQKDQAARTARLAAREQPGPAEAENPQAEKQKQNV